jgi:hypothetical protein
VWDVADADPGWLGPANLVALVLIGVLMGWLLRGSRAREEGGESRSSQR